MKERQLEDAEQAWLEYKRWHKDRVPYVTRLVKSAFIAGYLEGLKDA